MLSEHNRETLFALHGNAGNHSTAVGARIGPRRPVYHVEVKLTFLLTKSKKWPNPKKLGLLLWEKKRARTTPILKRRLFENFLSTFTGDSLFRSPKDGRRVCVEVKVLRSSLLQACATGNHSHEYFCCDVSISSVLDLITFLPLLKLLSFGSQSSPSGAHPPQWHPV